MADARREDRSPSRKFDILHLPGRRVSYRPAHNYLTRQGIAKAMLSSAAGIFQLSDPDENPEGILPSSKRAIEHNDAEKRARLAKSGESKRQGEPAKQFTKQSN